MAGGGKVQIIGRNDRGEIVLVTNGALHVRDVAGGGGGGTQDVRIVGQTVDVAIAEPVSVDDNGGSLTVDQATHDSLNANANMQIADADVGAANPVPVSDNGTTLSVDDGAGSLTVDQATHDSLNANANIQIADADVGAGNPVPVSDNGTTLSVDDGAGSLTVDQATHDSLNANANIQVGDADVSSGNPVPVDIVSEGFTVHPLSSSTNGRPINITTTVHTTIHTVPVSKRDTVTIYASNQNSGSSTDRTLSLGVGSSGAGDIIKSFCPSEETVVVLTQCVLEAGEVITAALDAAGSVNVYGTVVRRDA